MIDPVCTFDIISVGGGLLLALLTKPEQPRFIIASRRATNKSVKRSVLASLRPLSGDSDGACTEVASARPFSNLVIGWTKVPQNKSDVLLVFNRVSPNGLCELLEVAVSIGLGAGRISDNLEETGLSVLKITERS